jgi:hypothetical protein
MGAGAVLPLRTILAGGGISYRAGGEHADNEQPKKGLRHKYNIYTLRSQLYSVAILYEGRVPILGEPTLAPKPNQIRRLVHGTDLRCDAPGWPSSTANVFKVDMVALGILTSKTTCGHRGLCYIGADVAPKAAFGAVRCR